MVNLTSEFVRHIPCSNCGSSDGKAIYSDGHTYCFVCHDRTGGDNDVIHSQRMTKTVHLTGSAERLQKRNISEKTNQFYQIYRDGNTLRFLIPFNTIITLILLSQIMYISKQRDTGIQRIEERCWPSSVTIQT